MNERQKKFALLGGLFGAVYLGTNNLLPGIPDFLLGAIVGLGCLLFIMAMLPDEAVKRIRKWKRRGE